MRLRGIRSAALAALLLTAACAQRPVAAPSEAGAAESSDSIVLRPRATRAATSEELKRSITKVSFSELGGERAKVVFASYEPAALKKGQYVFRPAIAAQRGSQAAREFVSWPELQGSDWVYAAQLESKKYYWGFLDQAVEGRGHEVLVVWSQDGGKTWTQLPSIRKNHFSDEFHSFFASDQGKSYAVLRRTGEGDDPARGLDVFSSNDFGRSWTRETFIPGGSTGSEPNEECSFEMRPREKIAPDCALPFSVGSGRTPSPSR